jgi:hypothetical protein
LRRKVSFLCRKNSFGSGDFISSGYWWDEEWTVTDFKGKVVDRRIVRRLDSIGMSGMADQWSVCDCGQIVHGELCPECQEIAMIVAYEKEQAETAKKLLLKNIKKTIKPPKGVICL